MNTQKGFSTLLGLLLVLSIVGGGAYVYTQTEIFNNNNGEVQITPESDIPTADVSEKKKVVVDAKANGSVKAEVKQNQYIDPGRNFYFYHNFKVINETEIEGGQIAQLSSLGGEYPEDIISVSYRVRELFEDSDAKFGPFQLRYSEKKQCWETYTTSGKGVIGDVTFICTEPVGYTDAGLPIFVSTLRWKTYVIPIDKDKFVKLNISGSGSTKPLEDIVKSVHKI